MIGPVLKLISRVLSEKSRLREIIANRRKGRLCPRRQLAVLDQRLDLLLSELFCEI